MPRLWMASKYKSLLVLVSVSSERYRKNTMSFVHERPVPHTLETVPFAKGRDKPQKMRFRIGVRNDYKVSPFEGHRVSGNYHPHPNLPP